MEKTGYMVDYKICPECGKRFYVLFPELYVYKRYFKGRKRAYCSWACVCAHDKKTKIKHLAIERPRKKYVYKSDSNNKGRFYTEEETAYIEKLLNDGLTLKQIAPMVNRTYSALYNKFIYANFKI